MQIITRTLIILAAALLVVGVTMALGQSGALSSLSGGGGPQAQGHAYATTSETDETTDDTGAPPARGGHGEQGGMSLFGAVEIGKNLGVIGVIVAAVALVTGLTRRLARGTRGRPSPPPAAA